MTTTHDTIDWNRYWRNADEDDRESGSPSTNHATDVVTDFMDETDATDSFADVGCGPGDVTFTVAESYPNATVVGYDAATPVLEENRERARQQGVDNVSFEQSVLPEFHPDQAFDVVFCYFTLCYVRDVETALQTLFDAVAPGGYLVFNYQNRLAQSHWQQMADNPEEFLGDESPFDPDRFEERFRLVLDGESILSYEAVHDALGTWPQSVWSVVDRPDIRWAWRHHPTVYVPK